MCETKFFTNVLTFHYFDFLLLFEFIISIATIRTFDRYSEVST